MEKYSEVEAAAILFVSCAGITQTVKQDSSDQIWATILFIVHFS